MTENPTTPTPSTPAEPRRRCRRRGHKFAFVLLVIVAAMGIGYATHSHADRFHHGWGPGWGGRDCAVGKVSAESPLTQDGVKTMMERRLARWGNDNLTVGPITESDTAVTGSIVTKKEGALVQSFTFDKLTGRPTMVK